MGKNFKLLSHTQPPHGHFTTFIVLLRFMWPTKNIKLQHSICVYYQKKSVGHYYYYNLHAVYSWQKRISCFNRVWMKNIGWIFPLEFHISVVKSYSQRRQTPGFINFKPFFCSNNHMLLAKHYRFPSYLRMTSGSASLSQCQMSWPSVWYS